MTSRKLPGSPTFLPETTIFDPTAPELLGMRRSKPVIPRIARIPSSSDNSGLDIHGSDL